jgi:hypothetical protein
VIKAGSGFKFIPPDRVIRARGPGLALGGLAIDYLPIYGKVSPKVTVGP